MDCHNANDSFFGLFGVINANVHSLTEDGSCAAALSGDPKLTALTLVAGAWVQAPAADSPAIDAGDNATCLAVDQRQATRPQGNGCDVGAVELISNTPTPTPTLTLTPPLTPTASPTSTVEPGTPTATPTNVPDTTAVPTPNPLYLPLIQKPSQ